jgi:thiamine-monophosphate kinase
MSTPAEFSLIRSFFSLDSSAAGVPLGVGDDCALLDVAAGHVLAISVDTVVAGVHFFSDQPPESIGHKAVAAALSDLAAMGARPLGILLALTLPTVNERWLGRLVSGIRKPLEPMRVPLIGGDTTQGPLALSVTVLGEVKLGQELRRRGARPDDLVVVSGALGGSARGLQVATADPQGRATDVLWASMALQRYQFPEARLSLGMALAGRAHAAIDISDGLLSDLGHLCAASECGARLLTKAIPLDPILADLPEETALSLALSGGDDYEIVFAWPENALTALEALSIQLDLPLTVIGRFTDEPGIRLMDRNGEPVPVPESLGYQHFNDPTPTGG